MALVVAGLVVLTIVRAGEFFRAGDGTVYTERGALLDAGTLPPPLYPVRASVPVFDRADGREVGQITRTVIYPTSNTDSWTTGRIYAWVWNADLSPGLGEAQVSAREVNLRSAADAQVVGTLKLGAPLEKIHVNAKGSWAFAAFRVAMRSADLGREERGGSFWTNEHTVFTWTTREGGDVNGRMTEHRLRDPGYVLTPLMLLVLVAVYVSVTLARRKGRYVNKSKNTITISGVTSSAINVQSSLASALVRVEAGGQDEAAAGLVRLVDLVKGSGLPEDDKRQLLDLLETLADEAGKPEPKKGVLAALGKELGVSLTASVIADQATPLLEQISQLWR
ncbi:hypothetical protein SAMN05421869_108206 [Nonomuraea jiangxiensis]|uniref:Uncharacterized protein n=2 Tax=Nonomuraea jiangxiensis TaxID=633440 RepID=A0A1G8QDB5_9ACTN|nr:hypothetical protein SAMN05421869_108206 [Nonomuraea jiangxiensis]